MSVRSTLPASDCPADPEVALMLRVQRDEPSAFAELVERYWPKVFGRFFRALDDRQDAEDLAQDVFLRLYRARKTYQPRARLNTWIFHIAQNVARNALRTRRRRPSVRLGSLAGGEEELPAQGYRREYSEPPGRPLERLELAGVVRAAVSELAERQRTAMELHQFEDRTYVEIAEEMAMSPKAAKSLLYRARNQLRRDLSAFMSSG